MLYDAWLTKGGGERRVVLERKDELRVDDAFSYENDTYSVVRVDPGHDEYAAVIAAEWRGEVGIGQFVP